MSARCCDDIAVHSHDGGRTLWRDGRGPFVHRFRFEWRRPALVVCRPAGPARVRVTLNRYPGVVIGLYLHLGRRALSLLWGRPGRPYEVPVAPSA
nr:hypothetical protein [Micromonospora sp. DSM 115978]